MAARLKSSALILFNSSKEGIQKQIHLFGIYFLYNHSLIVFTTVAQANRDVKLMPKARMLLLETHRHFISSTVGESVQNMKPHEVLCKT